MLHLICALQTEAAPLIGYYNLRLHGRFAGFRLYTGNNGALTLTVSGIGKAAAAAATVYTASRFAERSNDAWLNVGIAGHANLETGTAVLINKITDAGSGKVWYPQMVFDSALPQAAVQTLDRPSARYITDLFDMEAAGFIGAATRVTVLELAHCIKIVSDTSNDETLSIEPGRVRALVARNLDKIAATITSIDELAQLLRSWQLPPPYLADCLSRWHFTATQRIVLQRQLQRWSLLSPETSPLAAPGIKDAADLLAHIDATLAGVRFSLQPGTDV